MSRIIPSIPTIERLSVKYDGTKPTTGTKLVLKLRVDQEGATMYFNDTNGNQCVRFNNKLVDVDVFAQSTVDHFNEHLASLLQIDEDGTKFITVTTTVNTFKPNGAVKSASL